MRAVGPLTASEADEIFGHEPEGLPVYPEGPVTLTLPVKLPTGQNGWVDDEISLTYMTCSLTICDLPTVGKLVPVKVPSMAAIGNP